MYYTQVRHLLSTPCALMMCCIGISVPLWRDLRHYRGSGRARSSSIEFREFLKVI